MPIPYIALDESVIKVLINMYTPPIIPTKGTIG